MQGLNKAETAAKHGDEQVKIWRRSYDVPPPPLDASDPRFPGHDRRYAGLDDKITAYRILKDTVARFLPYWHKVIAPAIQDGRRVLIAAHGNSLRALVKHLDGVSDADIVELNIPTGLPLVYELDDELEAASSRIPGRSGAGPQGPGSSRETGTGGSQEITSREFWNRGCQRFGPPTDTTGVHEGTSLAGNDSIDVSSTSGTGDSVRSGSRFRCDLNKTPTPTTIMATASAKRIIGIACLQSLGQELMVQIKCLSQSVSVASGGSRKRTGTGTFIRPGNAAVFFIGCDSSGHLPNESLKPIPFNSNSK